MLPIRLPLPRIAVSLLLLTGIGAIQNLPAEEGTATSVKVANSVTYVNLAKVNLIVGKMTPTRGNLQGTYSINVPLLKSQAETGQIVLPLLRELNDYALKGGSISGKCTAVGKEQPHRKVQARFGAYDQKAKVGSVEFTIDTGVRILEFKSTYHLSGDGLIAMN